MLLAFDNLARNSLLGGPFFLKHIRLFSDSNARRSEPINLLDQPHYHLRRPVSLNRMEATWQLSPNGLPTVIVPPTQSMSTPSAV